jgi:hypothetical protein
MTPFGKIQIPPSADGVEIPPDIAQSVMEEVLRDLKIWMSTLMM